MAERAPAATVRAQAALFDGGALLCARHRAGDADYWVLPGGHLEPGETLWEALVRELREETGLVVREGALWAVSEFRSNARHVVDVTFRVTRWEGTAALGSDPEAGGRAARLVGLAWHDRAAFAGLAFRPPILARRLRERWDAGADAAYLGVEEAA